ncbi:phenylalanine--tRNA ligase subunit beta [Candidatus Parcubacteria bacterium]|nr:phenylalanine--tRNA ligase subunit beta [Candidatus Parcubacteria bacterium]
MKISINELKKYVEVDAAVDELVAKIGAQLGEVEAVVDLSKKYKGIVIAKIISCEKHPSADKLNVCMIDNGQKEVRVVCGASNVREGLLVAWLPPGAIVPATFDKDPLMLETREIRGQLSSGMLASASELGLSADHSGILELDQGNPGDDFAKVFGLDDFIVDIENKMFTHRPDCFGLLGVAREIAGIQGHEFTSPDWYLGLNSKFQIPNSKELPLEVRNELPELVPRFIAQAVSGVSVKPSPLWLQIYLTKIDMKPINNIVDITNYMMHQTGQPLHAYDYDKLLAISGKQPIRHAQEKQAVSLETRKARKADKLKLLGGKELSFEDEDTILITSNDVPVGIGGVMGGADTEVDASTKNIVLECANFDLYSIRRTSMTHGLFTDAVTRFSKGQSPLQNPAVAARTIEEIIKLAGGNMASGLLDNNRLDSEVLNRMSVNSPVEVSVDFINERLGLGLSADKIVEILRSVEFVVEVTRGDILIVKAPFWRMDIEIAEDVVEEVGRLYGYDRLSIELPKRNIVPVGPDDLLNLKSKLRSQLSGMGANEVLTYSFASGNLLEKAGQDKDLAFKISNALSPELEYYRLSLLPSLLDKVHQNIKAGFDQFAIFEIGKVHGKSEKDKDNLPKELERLALVFADKKNSDAGAAYYQAFALMADIVYSRFGGVRLESLSEWKLEHKMFSQMRAPFDPKRSAVVYNFDKPLGIVGEFQASASNSLKLPQRTAGFELFLNPMLKSNLPSYSALSKYPGIEQDICLKTSFDLPFADIFNGLDESLRSNAPDDLEIKTSCIDIFSKDKTSKHTTFRISALSYNRTLTSEIINRLLDKASEDLKTKLDAERV